MHCCLQKVNDFVRDQTHGLIKDVVDRQTFQTGFWMLLVNVIYFKGTWLKPFDAKKTLKKPFHVSETSVKQVNTFVRIYNIYAFLSSYRST